MSSRAVSVRTSGSARGERGFWGWRIVVFAAIGLAMTAPGQTVGMSVFVDHLIDGLGLTRSQVSGAYLVGTLVGAASLPLVGRWIDRWGVRLTMTTVGFAFAAALAGMAGVVGLVTLTVGFAGIRMLGQGSLTLVSTTSVALWFERRRGLALGVATAAGGAVMSLAPLVLTQVIEALRWRATWLVAAGAVLVVVVPVARWGMRDSPASIGQHVDGVPIHSSAGSPASRDRSWTRTEASRTLMFWVIACAVAASGMIHTGLMFHQISLLGERGLTTVQAAANFLPQTAATIATTLAVGWLVDHLPPRLLIAASMGTLAVAMLLAQTAAPGWRAIVFGIALGVSGGAIRAEEAAIVPRVFGVAHIGAVRGLVMTLGVGASALGPYLLAVGHERFGGYGPALGALLVLPVVIGVVALFTSVPDAAMHARIRRRRGRRAPAAAR